MFGYYLYLWQYRIPWPKTERSQLVLRGRNYYFVARFQVLTAVLLKIQAFSDVTLCRLVSI